MQENKIKASRKKLCFSGVPVVCHDCQTELYKDNYEKCTVCGAYLCPQCKQTHTH